MSNIMEAQHTNPLVGDPELIRDFVTESREHVATIERQMLLLESNATSSDLLNAIFRAFHTIKGMAGFLELALVQAITHEIETLLDHARNSRLRITPAVVDIMLESADVLRREIDSVESGGASPGAALGSNLLDRIRSITAASITVPCLRKIVPSIIAEPAIARIQALSASIPRSSII